MNGEKVFTVTGAKATEATPISLADAGLRERDHLQEWVLQHPQVLGDVMVLTSEFGRWTNASGAVERDRLDVLCLDRDGQLVVVELKRDRAPDTVEMQALKYAALVSRFTLEDLYKVHADYLSQRRAEPVDAESAAGLIADWAVVTEEALRQPRLVLMASEFPKTVTATVVFLHQQLGLDIRLLAFQAYRTDHDVLITVSQLYPPPDLDEFVLSPEVRERAQERSARQSRQRELTTVARLIEADVLNPGERLEFRAPSPVVQSEVEAWLSEDPRRRYVAWSDDAARPFQWDADGEFYSPTGLAQHILTVAANKPGKVQGPLYWVNDGGINMVELAAEVAGTADAEVPVEVHLSRLSDGLRAVFEALEAGIVGLGPDVRRRSRARSLKYYGRRKLVDVYVRNDHLSLYLRGIPADEPDDSGLVVSIAKRYRHAQIRTLEDVDRAVTLLRRIYAKAT